MIPILSISRKPVSAVVVKNSPNTGNGIQRMMYHAGLLSIFVVTLGLGQGAYADVRVEVGDSPPLNIGNGDSLPRQTSTDDYNEVRTVEKPQQDPSTYKIDNIFVTPEINMNSNGGYSPNSGSRPGWGNYPSIRPNLVNPNMGGRPNMGRPDRPDNINRLGRPDGGRPNMGRPDRPDNMGRPDGGRPDRPDRPDNMGRPDGGRPDRPSGLPSNTGRPDGLRP